MNFELCYISTWTQKRRALTVYFTITTARNRQLPTVFRTDTIEHALTPLSPQTLPTLPTTDIAVHAVNTDDDKDLSIRHSDKCIARQYNLIHPGNSLRAISHDADRMRSTNGKNPDIHVRRSSMTAQAASVIGAMSGLPPRR